MLALLMTMLGGAGYVFAMKMTEVKKGNRYAATMVNYIFGVVASAVLMEKKIFFYNTPEGWFALGLSFVTAICMVAGMLYGRKCIAANGAPMQATFYKLGILIPMACSLLGVDPNVAMQVVGVGFMIGVIQDSVETALNSAGDVEFAATAEYLEWQKQGKEVSFKWDK